jgi:hypothetical protein
MVIGEMSSPEPRTPDAAGSLEYRGHRLRLLPRSPHAWSVVERQRCLGIVERCYAHIGDDQPRYATKRVGEEHVVVDGWTNDWRLAVEWLIDQQEASRGTLADH